MNKLIIVVTESCNCKGVTYESREVELVNSPKRGLETSIQILDCSCGTATSIVTTKVV